MADGHLSGPAAGRGAGAAGGTTDEIDLRGPSGAAVWRSDPRTRFAALAAHELRTPLTSILGYTSMVLAWWEVLPDDERREHIATVEAQARRLSRVVDRLLLLTQMDTGIVMRTDDPVDLRRIVGEVMGEMGESRQHVEVRGPGAVVCGDPDLLKEAILALVDNAVKHGSPPVVVDIEVDTTGDRADAVIRVADVGDGIDDDLRARIFDPFASLDGDGAPASGFGISLAVAREIARLHRGDLTCDEPTCGASFTLRVPA